jgi:hypothetical protein
MWNMMNDICGVDLISPLRGFRIRGVSFRRALPYANDFKAFSLWFTQKLLIEELKK